MKRGALGVVGTLCLLLLLGCTRSSSGLVWDDNSQSVQLSPEETSRTLEFPFVNRYARPVRIVTVLPGCSSCSRAQWDSNLVESGGKAVVKLVMDAAKRTGTVDTSMTVRDDQGGEYKLSAQLHIPEVVKLVPGHIRWRVGETDRRKVKVWINPEFPATITGLEEESADGLGPQIRKVDGNGNWELEFSPPTGTARWSGQVKVLTSRPEPRWKAVPLHLYARLD